MEGVAAAAHRQMGENTRILTALCGIAPRDPLQISALSLAYIGDTVYDLYVRTMLVHTQDTTVHAQHLSAARLVCAAAQAQAYRRVEDMLTPDELLAYKRGRNAHSGTTPKNASVGDYRVATGFEALLGHLFLRGEDDRIRQIMQQALSRREE